MNLFIMQKGRFILSSVVTKYYLKLKLIINKKIKNFNYINFVKKRENNAFFCMKIQKTFFLDLPNKPEICPVLSNLISSFDLTHFFPLYRHMVKEAVSKLQKPHLHSVHSEGQINHTSEDGGVLKVTNTGKEDGS